MTLQAFFVPLSIAVFLLVGTVVLVWEWCVAVRLRREKQALEALLAARQTEAKTAVELVVRTGRRLRKAEEQLKQLAARLESLEMHGNDRAYSYDQAISQVRKGANANKLVANFGMSKSEAELVALLHGRQAGAGSPRKVS